MNIRNTNELGSYFPAKRMHVSGNNPLSPFFVLPSLNHITNDTTTKTTVVKSVRNGTAIPPPIFFLTMIGPHGYTA